VVNELLAEWESDGFGFDDVEFWVVSIPGELSFIPNMLGSSDHSAFEDDDLSTIANTIGAEHLLDFVILDRHNVFVKRYNTADAMGFDFVAGAVSLADPVVRADFDAVVRSLL
jgi:hypothetical protein